uniref:hypothetical protein n=1 Tax=Nonomuraea sp. CA-251285 TaxID=3240002 RepID=UPI003F491C80
MMTTTVAVDGVVADVETWALLLGVLSPLAIAVVQQPRWTGATRMVIGWLCALIVGAVTCLANGVLTEPATALRVCVLTLVAAQAAYVGWQKAGIVPKIERATSPPPRPEDGRRLDSW